MDAAAPGRGIAPERLLELPDAPRAARGCSRSISDEDAAREVRGIAKRIGVTRIAQIGELERFGLHVTSAYRASDWSSTLGSGKSETLAGAIAGCVMEEAEKFCQERFVAEVECEATFEQVSDRAIDPLVLGLPSDTTYAPSRRVEWCVVTDLVTGTPQYVPSSVISRTRQKNDLLYSPRRGCRYFSTSGLAAGFSVTEALVHGLCEVVERHALKLAEQAIGNPGHLQDSGWPPFRFVDLSTCPRSTRDVCDAVRRAGYEVRILDVTSEIAVPTFAARIMIPRGTHGIDVAWPGYCAHPNPEVGINRALLECVQSRVTFLSGAREDFALKVRSLGRHERPRPGSDGQAFWFRPHVPKKPFDAIPGFVGTSAREDLAFIVKRLTAASYPRVLYRDMSLPEVAPARVVRTLVPGTETTNPFYTGLRARTLMVRDLMERHGW
jgi:ribosomal protein S12 methylthiotransferase accessory factor